MCVFLFFWGDVSDLPRTHLLSFPPGVRPQPSGGGWWGEGSLPHSSLIFFLNIFLPVHTSLNIHSLSLIPNKAWGWVGRWRWMFVLWIWKNVYSELLPRNEDQEKQMGEMLKCLQLTSWQGAGSEEFNLLMTWFTLGPCKKYSSHPVTHSPIRKKGKSHIWFYFSNTPARVIIINLNTLLTLLLPFIFKSLKNHRLQSTWQWLRC